MIVDDLPKPSIVYPTFVPLASWMTTYPVCQESRRQRPLGLGRDLGERVLERAAFGNRL